MLRDIFEEQLRLHRKCFQHYTKDKDIHLYLFVKNFLDDDNSLPYNAIQLKGCPRCEAHTKKTPECIELLTTTKERNQDIRLIENKCIYSFKKLQNITLIQLDLHDRVDTIVKEVRVYRSFKEINDKNINDLELIRSGGK